MTPGTTATAMVAAIALAGCAQLASGSGPPADYAGNRNWTIIPAVRLRAQRNGKSCGPAALQMVLERWGVLEVPRLDLGDPANSRGISAGQLRDEARRLGLVSFVFAGTPEDLAFEIQAGRPVVLGMARRKGLRRYTHFVVVVGEEPGNRRWLIADPDRGWQTVDHDALMTQWEEAQRVTIVIHPKDGNAVVRTPQLSLPASLVVVAGHLSTTKELGV